MQLPENAAEANRENHHCDNQYRIDTQCYGLPPPRISVASGTLSQGCKDGGSTARPSARRWRMTPHWARYAMATIKIPRAMSSPSPSGAPINKPASILLSHSYALGLISGARPPKRHLHVMGGHPFTAAPSEPRSWASQGPCFCLDQPRPAAPS
jgi:hypothetical protein